MTHVGASSSSHKWKYDVFLSFCGQDTRKNFIDHLFYWLNRDRIYTFKDDKELKRGENISLELMEAIEGSRIAIIVFSENYASSSWCLNELVKILDCKKDDRIEKVLPVFYKVKPSDVRHQLNTYAQAFITHEECFKDETTKIEIWKDALRKAADLSGWDQTNIADGHEAELTKKIVEEVLKTVNKTRLHVADYPIGLDSHLKNIKSLLNDGELDVVNIIGIYGPGGIGKTTIAKAVFSELSENFESSSFLANVREVSSQHKGLAPLQKQLLSDISDREEDKLYNEDERINIIKRYLAGERVLIVFDDVDDPKQFNKLVGGHDSFVPGSLIILTSRDKHVLDCLCVDEKYIYRVKEMKQNESHQLFCHHAFRQNNPLEGYEKLSNDVVRYARGLPLAFVVLGSLLYKRDLAYWDFQLKKLRKIPNDEISKKLEISYEALDDTEKTVFLDISCFGIGLEKDILISFLDACDLGGEVGIKSLMEKSLLTIDKYNELCMHDLIRDMGREIVRKQSPKNPGRRSRLWGNDALDVLRNCTGTEAVEAFLLYREPSYQELFKRDDEEESDLLTPKYLPLNTNGFSKMHGLRFLQIFTKEFKWEHSLQEQVFCFGKLVLVRWNSFPFEHIPDNFYLENLVILYMQNSNLKEVWKGTKCLTKLKELNLSFSEYLTHTPDFSWLPNLEKLDLNGCKSLIEVHESINRLKRLIELHLEDCSNLKNLPMLPSSLRFLDASFCLELKRLPNLSNLKHLMELNVSNCTKLTEIGGLDGLRSAKTINVDHCINLKSFAKKRIFQEISKDYGNSNVCDLVFVGNEVPDWFGFQSETWSNSLSFQVTTQLQLHNMEEKQPQGLIICIVCSHPMIPWITCYFKVVVVVFNESKNLTWVYQSGITFDSEEMTLVIKRPNCVWKSSMAAECGDTITVSAYGGLSGDGRYLGVKKIGAHVIHESQHEDVQYSFHESQQENASGKILEHPRTINVLDFFHRLGAVRNVFNFFHLLGIDSMRF